MHIMTVNVLGTDYSIKYMEDKENKIFPRQEIQGMCEFHSKEIFIRKQEQTLEVMRKIELFEHAVLRHEIVHAFMYESGLDSSWARNEELIDWIALQVPKMEKAMKSVHSL
ncbi:MAG: hypothetical protein ACRCZG_05670 [Culicoidibacterales bacterium]